MKCERCGTESAWSYACLSCGDEAVAERLTYREQMRQTLQGWANDPPGVGDVARGRRGAAQPRGVGTAAAPGASSREPTHRPSGEAAGPSEGDRDRPHGGRPLPPHSPGLASTGRPPSGALARASVTVRRPTGPPGPLAPGERRVAGGRGPSPWWAACTWRAPCGLACPRTGARWCRCCSSACGR